MRVCKFELICQNRTHASMQYDKVIMDSAIIYMHAQLYTLYMTVSCIAKLSYIAFSY